MSICDCFKNLTHEDKQTEILGILGDCKQISQNTSIILIYSKIETPTNVCLNTVRYKLRYGINKICICKLYRYNLNIKLKLAGHYLTKIEKIRCTHWGVEFFVIKPKNHSELCHYNRVPSLLHLSHFQLLINGISDRKLLSYVNEGIIPEIIFRRKIPCHSHLGFFGFSDLFNLWIPSVDNKIPSCAKPGIHLNINIFDQ